MSKPTKTEEVSRIYDAMILLRTHELVTGEESTILLGRMKAKWPWAFKSRREA